MFTKRQTVAIYVAMTLTAAFAGAVTWLEMQPPQMSRIAKLPAFALTDQDGRAVTLENFKGSVWLADFVYTTCPGPCPMITAHMARLQRKLPPEVKLASFSTDPANDTPAVLKAYAHKFNATGRWTFVTGPKGAEYDLINHGFLMAATAPPGTPIIHSTQMALVDKTGTIRGYYDGTSDDSDAKILEDVQKLLAE